MCRASGPLNPTRVSRAKKSSRGRRVPRGRSPSGVASGRVVDYFTVGGVKDWRGIWFVFAAYALVLGLIFPFAFRYDHDRRTAALREAAG